MKKVILLVILSSSLGFGQESATSDVPKGYHTHEGFYLSLNGGLALGTIILDATNGSYKKMEVGSAGSQYDFKIGYVISEEVNLILSLDILARVISSPVVTIDGVSPNSNTTLNAGDAMYGLGITKYFMPENYFISATAGVGIFSMNVNNKIYNSQRGFGFQIKGGKEWWVLDNWGLGVAAGLGYLSANANADPSNPSYSGKYSTTKFFVIFNTTFN
jgi:hypothetical protein